MDLSTLDIMPFMYLNCVFEIFLLHTLLGGLFQDRGGCKAVKVLKAAACITIMIIVNSFRLPWLNLVCVPIIYYAFARLNFLLELKYAILYIIIFYMILAGTEFAFSYAYKLFGINVTLARFGQIFILTIQDIFEFVIIQLVIRQHRAPYEGGNKEGGSKRGCLVLRLLWERDVKKGGKAGLQRRMLYIRSLWQED